MAAIGTIAQELRNGRIHIWGTGLDRRVNPLDRASTAGYVPPPHTQFVVHATRGPLSRQTFLDNGIPAPEIYGDPALLLPRLFAFDLEKKWDLGVIVHLSELSDIGPDAQLRETLARYRVPPELADRVRIINTWTPRSARDVLAKVEEIGHCRRALSTSLHGLTVAEILGVPALHFPIEGQGLDRFDVMDPACRLDHRFRDYYAGTGRATVRALGQQRHLTTPWRDVFAMIDDAYRPPVWDPAPLLRAFPHPLAMGEPIALDALPPEITTIRF